MKIDPWVNSLGMTTSTSGLSRPTVVPYLSNRKLVSIFDGLEKDVAPDDFSQAVGRFLSLTVQDREQATQYVYKHFRDFVDAVGEDEVDLRVDSPAQIWRHVKPTEIYVKRRYYGDKKVYVKIAAECDWEQEHGLQIIYRDGMQLSRVSDQDGHLAHADAYALPEGQDRIC